MPICAACNNGRCTTKTVGLTLQKFLNDHWNGSRSAFIAAYKDPAKGREIVETFGQLPNGTKLCIP